MTIHKVKANVLLGALALFFSVAPGYCEVSAQKAPKKRPVVKRGTLATATSRAEPKYSPEKSLRVAAFYEVWSAISVSYYDGKFSGLDWNKVRREYEPKAIAAKSDAELHDLLSKMIGLLKRSHLGIVSPENYEVIRDTKRAVRFRERQQNAAPGAKVPDEADFELEDEDEMESAVERFGLGVDIKLIDDKFIVTRVDKSSTSEKAGIKLGQAVEKINGVSLQLLLDEVTQFSEPSEIASLKGELSTEIVESMFVSTHDLPIELTVSDGVVSKVVKVTREPLRNAETVAIFPNFPPKLFQFESRALNEKTGYIRFNLFGLPVVEKFSAAVSEHKSKESIVIDLRGNTGGLIAVMPILAGMLSPRSTEIGTMQYRLSEQILIAKSLAKHFTGRIVVLVDGRTASAGEIFALLLREHGRTTVVGETTAGEALPSTIVKLSTGAVFQYPVANFRSGKGKYLEGVGLVPDHTIVLDRKSLLEGRDTQLELSIKLSSIAPAALAVPQPPIQAITNTVVGDPLPPPPMRAVPKAVSQGPFPPPPVSLEVPRVFAPGHDKVASGLLSEFITLVGGKAALAKLRSYSFEGLSTYYRGGVELEFKSKTFRDSSGNFAEHLLNESAGETRQIVDGKKVKIYPSLGEVREIDLSFELNELDPLGVFFELADPDTLFPSLIFTGEYDREGRKTKVVEGKDRKGNGIALAFDVETKMLVSISSKIRNVSFGDYRKVNDIQLPFRIERAGLQTAVSSITINPPIEKTNFEPRQNCYDRP